MLEVLTTRILRDRGTEPLTQASRRQSQPRSRRFYGSTVSADLIANTSAAFLVTGPGAAGSAWPSTPRMGCTSLVVPVRKASSAVGQRRQRAGPARRRRPTRSPAPWSPRPGGPADSGGVEQPAGLKPRTRSAGALAQVAGRVREDRLAAAVLGRVGQRPHVLPVGRGLQPGQRAVLVARPRAPWSRPRSACGRLASAIATIAVSGAPPRSEPSGAIPPVTVIRIRASSGRRRRLDHGQRARLDLLQVGLGQARARPPSGPAAPGAGSARTARPPATLIVSKTPSPITSPWSKIEIRASSSGTRRPVYPHRHGRKR